jgi:serine/threonine-protein kinase RsbW
MHEGSITIHVAADVREIEHLNKLIRQFGELHEIPSRALYSVNLALDELVTNVVLYGFDDPAGRKVKISLTTKPGLLEAAVEDDGKFFNPLDATPPDLNATLAQRDLGGLGIHLVRSLMDHVSYVHENGKNVLTIQKRIR